MTLDDIILSTRDRLDDLSEPYRWSDAILLEYANEAEREACRRAHLIIDKETDSICRIPVVAGNSIYSLSSKIIKIRACYLGPYVRGELSWNSTSSSLIDASNRFVTAGFEDTDQFTVMGFPTIGNNGLFSATSVAAGSIAVNETGMVTETGTDIVVEGVKKELRKMTGYELDSDYSGWRIQAGEPVAFIQEEDGEIRLVNVPVNPNTLHLTVSRFPLEDMSLSTRTSVGPEIPTEYHGDIVDWMCHLAHLKDDADSSDIKKAQYYESRFTSKFGSRSSARAEQFKKHYPRELRVRSREFGF